MDYLVLKGLKLCRDCQNLTLDEVSRCTRIPKDALVGYENNHPCSEGCFRLLLMFFEVSPSLLLHGVEDFSFQDSISNSEIEPTPSLLSEAKYIGLLGLRGTDYTNPKEIAKEIEGGRYSRQPVSWVKSGEYIWRPSDALVFVIPEDHNVLGWSCFKSMLDPEPLIPWSTLKFEYYKEEGAYVMLSSVVGIKVIPNR